jgi:hypothetical protein
MTVDSAIDRFSQVLTTIARHAAAGHWLVTIVRDEECFPADDDLKLIAAQIKLLLRCSPNKKFSLQASMQLDQARV